ncbi:hypothetical protein VHUM_04360 [Vanrija humicola]|uniref:Proteasome assembly chaperone 4 n=1 Tax=Vanrija humicola TaxID=5417 RepID=A0A7D8YW24_VANHU|nr:hypothetical protein VHUM_04360 [Vanrija humicola]
MADLEPHTTTAYTYIPAPYPGAPAFQFQLTRLADTLLVWVGTGGPAAAEKNKRLASDWAVAMPSRGNIPTTATPIFRSGATDTALHMAQRLSKRFPPNQIHLSLSLPSNLTAPAGPGLDPYASKALLVMEKKLVAWLTDVLKA